MQSVLPARNQLGGIIDKDYNHFSKGSKVKHFTCVDKLNSCVSSSDKRPPKPKDRIYEN